MDNCKGMHMTEVGIYADTLCIIGKGAAAAGGYKRTTVNGIRMYAHRVAWAEAHGPIPAGMYVCHRCDNRLCVNVDHLFLGTHTDNMRDMVAKGRDKESKKTACPQGHSYSGTDFQGRRICHTCRAATCAAGRARKKLARGI